MDKELSLLERVQQDEALSVLWSRLSEEIRQNLIEVDAGKRVPDFLNDTIFKGIFDPDIYGERLSRFISSILGKKVTVLHSLKNEGQHHSTYSKGIILDIVVKFEDGSIGNVEVQRYGVAFPSKRAACYSADLVTRQYAVSKGEKKKNVDYNVIQPVYTIKYWKSVPKNLQIQLSMYITLGSRVTRMWNWSCCSTTIMSA